MITKYVIILSLLVGIMTTSHIDFVIHIPSTIPLYLKADPTITFSGGTLSMVDGVYILCCP